MDQKDTMLGKSDGGCDEEKLKADTIIPINLFDRPSPFKVYRHTEFEIIGKLSRNRAKDSKGTRYRLSLCFFVLKVIHAIYLVFFQSWNKSEAAKSCSKPI